MYCETADTYGNKSLDTGSLASHAVIRESFLFTIPDAVSLEDAAPMMCAGATVFEALNRYGVKSTDRVGVIGVGGLGHLAIQLLKALTVRTVVVPGVSLGSADLMARYGVRAASVSDTFSTGSRSPIETRWRASSMSTYSAMPPSLKRPGARMPCSQFCSSPLAQA